MGARPQSRLHLGLQVAGAFALQLHPRQLQLGPVAAPLELAEPGRVLDQHAPLRDDVGDAERARHQGAEPVGLAVVAVVGEPEVETLGMAGRQALPARDETCRLGAGAALQRKMRLGPRHAGGNAAERRHDDPMTELGEQPGESSRHFAITRRQRTIRRLERRVQQHPHELLRSPNLGETGLGRSSFGEARLAES